MAAPSVLARASNVTGTSDITQHDITLPADIAAGERLCVVFSVDGDPTCAVDTKYSGEGWEKVGQASYSSTVTGAVFVKVAEGGSPAADRLRILTETAQQSSHISFRISAANMYDGASANGSSTNSDPPNLALTAGSPTPEVLWIATRSGDSTVQASAAPASYGSLTTRAASGTTGAATATAEYSTTAVSENPGAFTSNSEQWVSWTLGFYNVAESAARLTQAVVEAVTASDAATGRLTQLVIETVSQGSSGTPSVGGGMLVIAT